MIRARGPAVVALTLGLISAARADLIGGVESPGQRLRAAIEAYWDDEMRADPLGATYNGDHRYDDRMPDPSEAAHDARVGRLRATRDAVDAICPDTLGDQDRLDREVLIFLADDRLARERFRAHLIPFTQQEGLPLQFAQTGNFHPASTAGDVENYLRRLRGLPAAVDATIAVMRRGMAEGRVPPRVSMAKTVPQLRALATARPEDSPLWRIVDRLPRDWSGSTRDRARDDVRGAIAGAVAPAYARLADFVEKEYLPACREGVGLRDSPDGAEHYAALARSFTTTDRSPDAIHAVGLAEVARTRAAMDEVRRKVGFDGDLAAFLAHVRADPKLRAGDEAAILARYRTILGEVDAKLPLLFGRLPRANYAIRTMEAYRAKSAPAGYYYPPPEDGSRPGYFYINTSDSADRSTQSMPALAYHEAVPGHHLQIALAIEAPGRPGFRRFGYFPAFSEGWALYAEGLTREVGLAVDPYSELGRLEYNAWRSARLVVDTGMHHRGWTRDRAVDYLQANTAMPRIEVESEVDRYIAWPGQALAYKVGELKIREIRARAEARLGPKFDIRAFHDRLLSQGSIPLGILETMMASE